MPALRDRGHPRRRVRLTDSSRGRSRRLPLAANRDLSLWRYRALLPVPDDAVVLPPPRLQVGFTPVVEAPALAKELGLGAFFVKDDGPQPDGFLQGPRELGGRPARAMARPDRDHVLLDRQRGLVARGLRGRGGDERVHLRARPRPPRRRSPSSSSTARRCSSSKGPYEDAFRVCQAAVEAFGWYNRNCAINPYLVEGKKTCGLEIAEQMRDDLPDVVTVALGDGCTTAGIWKGLVEMKTHGVIDRLPRILAVQAEGAAPLAKTFARGDERIEPVDATTLADSINVGAPPERDQGPSRRARLGRRDRDRAATRRSSRGSRASRARRASSPSPRASPRSPASRPRSRRGSCGAASASSTSRPATA